MLYCQDQGIFILKFANNFVYLVFTYRKTIHTIFKWWRQIIFKVITVILMKFVLTTKTDRAKIIIKVITYDVRILNIMITNMQLLYIISTFIMRPSSLGGGRIMRRTLSVRLSVCPSVCPSVPLLLPSVTSRHLANYNDTHVLFGKGRISYGHLGRTNSCFYPVRRCGLNYSKAA